MATEDGVAEIREVAEIQEAAETQEEDGADKIQDVDKDGADKTHVKVLKIHAPKIHDPTHATPKTPGFHNFHHQMMAVGVVAVEAAVVAAVVEEPPTPPWTETCV